MVWSRQAALRSPQRGTEMDGEERGHRCGDSAVVQFPWEWLGSLGSARAVLEGSLCSLE